MKYQVLWKSSIIEFSALDYNFQADSESGDDSGNSDDETPVSVPVSFEASCHDSEEAALIEKFFHSGPCCKLGPRGTPCVQQFDCEDLKQARLDNQALEKSDLDIAILATNS